VAAGSISRLPGPGAAGGGTIATEAEPCSHGSHDDDREPLAEQLLLDDLASWHGPGEFLQAAAVELQQRQQVQLGPGAVGDEALALDLWLDSCGKRWREYQCTHDPTHGHRAMVRCGVVEVCPECQEARLARDRWASLHDLVNQLVAYSEARGGELQLATGEITLPAVISQQFDYQDLRRLRQLFKTEVGGWWAHRWRVDPCDLMGPTVLEHTTSSSRPGVWKPHWHLELWNLVRRARLEQRTLDGMLYSCPACDASEELLEDLPREVVVLADGRQQSRRVWPTCPAGCRTVGGGRPMRMVNETWRLESRPATWLDKSDIEQLRLRLEGAFVRWVHEERRQLEPYLAGHVGQLVHYHHRYRRSKARACTRDGCRYQGVAEQCPDCGHQPTAPVGVGQIFHRLRYDRRGWLADVVKHVKYMAEAEPPPEAYYQQVLELEGLELLERWPSVQYISARCAPLEVRSSREFMATWLKVQVSEVRGGGRPARYRSYSDYGILSHPCRRMLYRTLELEYLTLEQRRAADDLDACTHPGCPGLLELVGSHLVMGDEKMGPYIREPEGQQVLEVEPPPAPPGQPSPHLEPGQVRECMICGAAGVALEVAGSGASWACSDMDYCAARLDGVL